MAINFNVDIAISPLFLPQFEKQNIKIKILRLDQIHPLVSGNKWFKLKEYFNSYKKGDYEGIITFGGAYSNHLVATAAAGLFHHIPVIGYVRGEDGKDNPSESLRDCMTFGMQLEFISRSNYKLKSDPDFLQALQIKYPKHLIIPEGGFGVEGIEGARSIMEFIPKEADIICCPVGSATTFCGLINGLHPNQKAIGFAALKQADYLKATIREHCENPNWALITDYHFGGFGKFDSALIDFINQFKKTQNIALDFVYTAKMMYGLFQLIEKEHWENKQIVCLHTGGLQGNRSIQHLLS